jgi:two-component system, chemotaxis family, CheB/CheR fusion protein
MLAAAPAIRRPADRRRGRSRQAGTSDWSCALPSIAFSSIANPTLTLPVLVQFNGAPHRVHLHVKPAIEDEDASPRRAVVMFIEGEALDEALVPPDHPHGAEKTVRKPNEELQLTRARLRTTLEESESANEELWAANEELQID